MQHFYYYGEKTEVSTLQVRSCSKSLDPQAKTRDFLKSIMAREVIFRSFAVSGKTAGAERYGEEVKGEEEGDVSQVRR